MKPWGTLLIGVGVCAFVLWPVFISAGARGRLRAKKAKLPRRLVGCIPVHKGEVYLITGRAKHKLSFPKGGLEAAQTPYYAAGKEALEEIGLIGNIDVESITRDGDIDWYIMEVTRVLDDWKERHERIRVKMTVEEVLLHSEVRAVAKVVLKSAIVAESVSGYRRLVQPSDLIDPMLSASREPARHPNQPDAQLDSDSQ